MPKTNKVENMKRYNAIRAIETWQRAGAYSVRVQGMNRQHHISLQEEFDEHDGAESKYIVLLDDTYPVATCRFYELNIDRVLLGRVVVLPEYEKRGVGTRLLKEGEAWAKELGYSKTVIEARDILANFYEARGYKLNSKHVVHREPFDCFLMEKRL
jgi:GNAT superfamily N-acetyltransferase